MVGLIAASLILITVASITLGFGWLGANSALVWLSILCSASTAIALSVAYSKSRQMADNAAACADPAASGKGAGSWSGGGRLRDAGHGSAQHAQQGSRVT